MLSDSAVTVTVAVAVAVAVAEVVMRTHPRLIPLAMIAMRKSIYGSFFFPIWVWCSTSSSATSMTIIKSVTCSFNSPGHYQKWIYGDVIRNGNIWPPKLGTLYKVSSELFSGLKSSLFPQGFAHNTAEQRSFVECEKNGGPRGVFEFRGENLTVLCYFCSGLYTTRRQIDVKIRYVAILPVFEKNMSLMSIKFAFIWWYFCVGP